MLAGGSGNRMQGQVEDKVLAALGSRAVIAHSVQAFADSKQIAALVLVCRDEEQQSAIRSAIESLVNLPETTFALGGAERQDSVWAGLKAAPSDTEIALIHDCARPCVTPEAIRESIAKVVEFGAACLARPVSDTIKSADSYDGAYLPTTVDRSKLWAMETPQSFRFEMIRSAYETVISTGQRITDDLSAIEDIDQPVAFVSNGQPNPKLTTPDDLPYLEYLLAKRS
nr:IspD/TarI family cytidylyltransferase [Pelagicoccus albus]